MRRCTFPILLLVALLAGCRAPMDLPSGFVELRDSGDGFRATTSDDARLWVRSMYDPTDAALEFWSQALHADLEQRGYELVDRGEASNEAGQTGRWSAWTANVGGERIGYLVALWVHDPSVFTFWLGGDWLQIVEFAAPQEAYDGHRQAVQDALRTVRW